MSRLKRRSVIGGTVLTVVLGIGATAGCESVSTAMDCVRVANAVTASVNDLQQAVGQASSNPADAQKALADIDKSLTEIGDTTKNADLAAATADLKKAVADVGTALRDGNANPDIAPVQTAAGDLTKVCSP
ncbi:hypothetical protein ACIGD1_18900 [Streptomyces sp. NPDC085612]|uniref:hypothetical protein n=1 Tax=Streptomyces sp. NPDC085612 TaxID=3365732 RepID=UPI0037CDB0F1